MNAASSAPVARAERSVGLVLELVSLLWFHPLSFVSWRFFLLAPTASLPISADHCRLQMALECNALPAPSWFANTSLLLY